MLELDVVPERGLSNGQWEIILGELSVGDEISSVTLIS